MAKNINVPSESALQSKNNMMRAIQDLYWIVKDLSSGSGGEVEQQIEKLNSEVYSLKKAVGDLGGAVTFEFPDASGKSFNTLMGNNGTVKLSEDVTTSRFGPGILAKNNVTLDLAGHNISFTNAASSGGVQARGTMVVNIKGKGIFDSGTGIAVLRNGKDAVINLSGSTTIYQADRPSAELIYCYAGTINISGGTFKNNGSRYMLNCYDANYRNGTAKIIVTGGKFYDFNPADNTAEGEHTNFLAEGYKATASTVIEEGVEHTVYTVSRA